MLFKLNNIAFFQTNCLWHFKLILPFKNTGLDAFIKMNWHLKGTWRMECKIEKISIKLAALQIITYESTNYLTI